MSLMGVIDRKGCYNSDPGGNCKLQRGGGGWERCHQEGKIVN